MNRKDSDDLTRVGPGTVMGNFMRAVLDAGREVQELEPDGPPLRLRLLGENLIAFRDSAGAVGVMDHLCPHRGASMFFGRNEEGGLRCVYHGWKFDVSGDCVDMPSGRRTRLQEQGARRRPTPPRSATASSGSTWARDRSRRRCRDRGDAARRAVMSHQRSRCAAATGCRRWRATSTPRTSASCTSATSTRRGAGGSPAAAHGRRARRRIPRARHALGHDLRRLPRGRPRRPTGASRTSCSRSSRRRRRASSR